MYTDQFAPYNFINDKGELVGVNTDIVKVLCVKAQVDCDFKVVPWKRAFTLVNKTPHSAIFSIAKHKNRVPIFNWLGPLVSGKTYFYKLKSNSKVSMAHLEEAKKYSLGMVRGDIYESLVNKIGFTKEVNLMTFGEEHQYIELFISKRIDLILGSEHVIHNQLKRYGLSLNDVEKLQELSVTSDLKDNYLAFNKEVPEHIIYRFNEAYNAVTQKPGLANFMQPYSYLK